jgi:ABC-type arginine transport system ATPase subunit
VVVWVEEVVEAVEEQVEVDQEVEVVLLEARTVMEMAQQMVVERGHGRCLLIENRCRLLNLYVYHH